MRALMKMLKGFTGLFLLTVMLISWGMGDALAGAFTGSGGGGGGFTGRPLITIGIAADKTTLPVNITGNTQFAGPYMSTFYVTVKQDGNMFPAPSVSVTVASGLNTGALYYFDGDTAHQTCTTNAAGTQVCTEKAYRSMVFKDTTGIVSGHFLAGSTPGTAVLTATATDPNTNQTVSANLAITIAGGGGGIAGGASSTVTFVMDPAPVYIRTNPDGTTPISQSSIKLFQVFVLDDFNQPVNPPADNNIHTLRVELLPNRPNGGEWLSTTDAAGRPQEGAFVLANMVGGAATLALHAGTLPGTVVIAATADRADNNVDNGIQMGITNYAMVSIGTGVISSLTFTGPFADAVDGRWNWLAAQLIDPNSLQCPDIGPPPDVRCWKDALWDGTFIRYVNVIASDAYGNPPPAGTPITFRLIDSPLDMLQNRYPDQGHGQFAITGYNGDPQEGGWAFFAPNRAVPRVAGDTLNPFVVPNGVSWALADPLCLLVLQDPEVINPNPSTINGLPSEGRLEYHVGSRIITGRQGNMLTVNTPFNQVSQNVGANVWYTVGCPPHKGNVMNFNTLQSPVFGYGEINVMTDVSGVARTIVNYPASQVGRRFMLMAESNGGKVGAVMTHWYLGIPDGSIVAVIDPPSLAQQMPPLQTSCGIDTVSGLTAILTVNPGAAISQPITLQLLDGGLGNGDCSADGVPDGTIRTPIPGVPIAVNVTINDPAEIAAIVAEEAVAEAQAVFDAFVAANPGVCDKVIDPANPDAVVERDPVKCAKKTELQATLDTAQEAAVAARTVANLHTPTASVTPATLASGAGGYSRAVLNVNDLPIDGSVVFSFSTIGPEIRSKMLTITVQPPAAVAAP